MCTHKGILMEVCLLWRTTQNWFPFFQRWRSYFDGLSDSLSCFGQLNSRSTALLSISRRHGKKFSELHALTLYQSIDGIKYYLIYWLEVETLTILQVMACKMNEIITKIAFSCAYFARFGRAIYISKSWDFELIAAKSIKVPS